MDRAKILKRFKKWPSWRRKSKPKRRTLAMQVEFERRMEIEKKDDGST